MQESSRTREKIVISVYAKTDEEYTRIKEYAMMRGESVASFLRRAINFGLELEKSMLYYSEGRKGSKKVERRKINLQIPTDEYKALKEYLKQENVNESVSEFALRAAENQMNFDSFHIGE